MRPSFFIIFLILFSCSKNNKQNDQLEISIANEISTLDPANCYDAVCYLPVAQVYETLFELEYLKRPYSLRPLLAEDFPAISQDRLTYTFKIKKGIKYHSSPLIPKGREVKAQDFAQQIKRLAFKGTRSQGFWLIDDKIKGVNEWRDKVDTDLDKFFKEELPGVSTPDDHTLIINLNRPYPQLLFGLAMTFVAPIPEEAIRATQNDFTLKSVGTGPYIITDYHPAQAVTLKKFDGYNSSFYPTQGDRFANEKNLLKDAGKKLPFIPSIKMKVIKETQTEWLNFISKKIDMINLTSNYQQALSQDGKIKEDILKQDIQLQASPTLIYWWISFNMKDPVVGKNLNLRKAIAHAIDIDKYLELFTYRMGQKANSIFPPGIFGYSPSSELPYEYNLEKAKEYLKDAGYPEGKGLPTLTFDIRGTDTRRRQMGEYIQQELRALGINVIVRQNTFPAFLEKSRKGELQFWQGGWIMDYPDAENVLQLLTTDNLPPGPNSSQYSNSQYDEMFNQVKKMEDTEAKAQLMKKMEMLVNQDLPWVMQYYSRNYILYHDYLKNFRYSDIIYNNIKYLKLEKK